MLVGVRAPDAAMVLVVMRLRLSYVSVVVFPSGTGNDILDGGDGIDTADYSDVENEDLIIDLTSQGEKTISTLQSKDTFISIEGAIGGQGDDILIGTSGANTLVGEKGNDTIIGNGASSGTDYIDGGENDLGAGDLVSFTYTNKNLKVDLSFNTGSNANVAQVSGDGNLIIKNIEDLLGGFGNDTLIGNDDKNTISGGTGNDTLVGKGGDGIDTADYSDVENEDLIIDLTSQGEKTISTLQGKDTFISIEGAIGGQGDDILTGNAGNDFLEGKEGNDTLLGGTGDDTLKGGAGDDTFDGGDGIDTVDYSDVTNENLIIDLNSQGEKTISINEGKDTFISIEGAIGGQGNDILIGTSGANTLIGGAGSDTILGNGSSSGIDYIDGGINDIGAGDLVSFASTNKNIKVDLSFNVGANENVAQNTGDGNLIMKNIEDIQGGFGNDILIGNDDKNTILGGTGNDTLVGKGANDTLIFVVRHLRSY